MWKNIKDRLKSKVVWLAVLAQALVVLGYFVTPEMVIEIKVIIMAIVEIATLFGVLNNPADNDHF